MSWQVQVNNLDQVCIIMSMRRICWTRISSLGWCVANTPKLKTRTDTRRWNTYTHLLCITVSVKKNEL